MYISNSIFSTKYNLFKNIFIGGHVRHNFRFIYNKSPFSRGQVFSTCILIKNFFIKVFNTNADNINDYY